MLAVAPIALVLVVQLVLFPTPPAVWLQGAILGLPGALMAVGLALVYRLNRVVNFAQGDLGSAPAVLAYGLIALSGVDYFIGLLTGLVAVVLLTGAIEIVVIRRFVSAPRLILTVATIGLSQALVVVALLIPRIWGNAPLSATSIGFPWRFHVSFAPVVFDADYVVALVVAPLVLGAVAIWSKRSDLGVAARATGDRRSLAAMLGIPVNRLQTITWVVAGTLSFLGIFLKAAILGLPLDPTFGLIALVSALAALTLGGFTHLGRVAGAAVAVGILQQGVAWDDPASPTLVLAVLAAVVVAGMVLSRAGSAERGRDQDVSWTLVTAVRPLPAGLARLPEVRTARMAGVVAAAAGLATLPLWLGPGALLELSTLAVLALVGCSIVVLTGWSGQVSLGQMSFAAVGAVVGAVTLIDAHWDLALALPAAGMAGAAAATLVALPTLRRGGIFVAVTTLAFALATSGYLLDRAEFGWIPRAQLGVPTLFGIPIGSEERVFFLCVGTAVVLVMAMDGLRSSRVGRAWRANGANRRAAAGYGISSSLTTLTSFAVSGGIAGIAGCLLLVVNQQYVETPYDATQSLAVFTATVVGGLGSATGAIVGAVLVEGSAVFLPPSWQLFPLAAGVLIVLFAFPGGVAGLWFRARDHLAGLAARRHGLTEPDGTEPDGTDRPARPVGAGSGPTPAVAST